MGSLAISGLIGSIAQGYAGEKSRQKQQKLDQDNMIFQVMLRAALDPNTKPEEARQAAAFVSGKIPPLGDALTKLIGGGGQQPQQQRTPFSMPPPQGQGLQQPTPKAAPTAGASSAPILGGPPALAPAPVGPPVMPRVGRAQRERTQALEYETRKAEASGYGRRAGVLRAEQEFPTQADTKPDIIRKVVPVVLPDGGTDDAILNVGTSQYKSVTTGQVLPQGTRPTTEKYKLLTGKGDMPVGVHDVRSGKKFFRGDIPLEAQSLFGGFERAHELALRREKERQLATFAQQASMMDKSNFNRMAAEARSVVRDSLELADDFKLRLAQMEHSLANPNAQNDVSLLFNHMGMTLGDQRGARMTQAMIQHAIDSRSAPQALIALYLRAVRGESLTPLQRRQMVELARTRYDVQQDRTATIQRRYRPFLIGSAEAGGPPPPPGAGNLKQTEDAFVGKYSGRT